MMPTQECTVSGAPGADAGLIGERELAVQRCSMGAGAAMRSRASAASSSSMNARSAPLGRLPAPRAPALGRTPNPDHVRGARAVVERARTQSASAPHTAPLAMRVPAWGATQHAPAGPCRHY